MFQLSGFSCSCGHLLGALAASNRPTEASYRQAKHASDDDEACVLPGLSITYISIYVHIHVYINIYIHMFIFNIHYVHMCLCMVYACVFLIRGAMSKFPVAAHASKLLEKGQCFSNVEIIAP